jgi:hypothetical protein
MMFSSQKNKAQIPVITVKVLNHAKSAYSSDAFFSGNTGSIFGFKICLESPKHWLFEYLKAFYLKIIYLKPKITNKHSDTYIQICHFKFAYIFKNIHRLLEIFIYLSPHKK